MVIKVLLVDDSTTARQLLTHIINSGKDMQVVGEALNGVQAVQMVETLHPDVILMDVFMPVMDGLEATREIMSATPTPIVLISTSFESKETQAAFEAINAGALAVLPKPGGPKAPNYEASIKEIRDMLRAMAEVRVIRHPKLKRIPPVPHTAERDTPKPETSSAREPEIVAIVASTGGPQALGEIIRNLPSTFSLPLVIVQHITSGFIAPLVEWLSSVSRLPVRIARAAESPLQGTIYLAPGAQHLSLTRDHRFRLSDTPTDLPHTPSGDVFLESIAQHYGAHAIGIVLTGMGTDGARGLRAMYQAGAMTIAQDEASCVVFGMPQEAIARGAVRQTLSPGEISKLLVQYTVDWDGAMRSRRP